jgi:hypothetical protein
VRRGVRRCEIGLDVVDRVSECAEQAVAVFARQWARVRQDDAADVIDTCVRRVWRLLHCGFLRGFGFLFGAGRLGLVDLALDQRDSDHLAGRFSVENVIDYSLRR